MKHVFNTLLIAAIICLAWLCYDRITAPIEFQEKQEAREQVVIAKLDNIRKAEKEFYNQNGRYTASFDTLATFLKTGKSKKIRKEGSLTDAQLKRGLTEIQALAILKSGGKMDPATYKELVEMNFTRDTTLVSNIEAIYGEDATINVDSLCYIPFADGDKFVLQATIIESSGLPTPVMECSAHDTTFLKGLEMQEIVNLIDRQKEMEHFPGLKFGSLEKQSNNAGNWE